jgi:hypothetical protein
LQRLDTLEELIRTSNSNATPVPGVALLPIANQFPALERTESSTFYHINVETILAWPVFQCDNLSQKQDIKALLQSASDPEPLPLSASLDFENGDARHLLQKFMQHVHIYNPVLEADKIEEYMRDALFNGLGWDAKSCLLVSSYTYNEHSKNGNR